MEIDLGLLGKTVLCDGWATYKRIYQNAIFLVASAPATTDELKKVASDCLVVAAGAAYAAWAETPSPEISVRTAQPTRRQRYLFIVALPAVRLSLERFRRAIGPIGSMQRCFSECMFAGKPAIRDD